MAFPEKSSIIFEIEAVIFAEPALAFRRSLGVASLTH